MPKGKVFDLLEESFDKKAYARQHGSGKISTEDEMWEKKVRIDQGSLVTLREASYHPMVNTALMMHVGWLEARDVTATLRLGEDSVNLDWMGAVKSDLLTVVARDLETFGFTVIRYESKGSAQSTMGVLPQYRMQSLLTSPVSTTDVTNLKGTLSPKTGEGIKGGLGATGLTPKYHPQRVDPTSLDIFFYQDSTGHIIKFWLFPRGSVCEPSNNNSSEFDPAQALTGYRVCYTKKCFEGLGPSGYSNSHLFRGISSSSSTVKVFSDMCLVLHPMARLRQLEVEAGNIFIRQSRPAFAIQGKTTDLDVTAKEFFHLKIAGEQVPRSIITEYMKKSEEDKRELTIELHKGFGKTFSEHVANQHMVRMSGRSVGTGIFEDDYQFLKNPRSGDMPAPYPVECSYASGMPYYVGRDNTIVHAPLTPLNPTNLEHLKSIQNDILSPFGLTVSGVMGERQGNSTSEMTFEVTKEKAELKGRELLADVTAAFVSIGFDMVRSGIENILVGAARDLMADMDLEVQDEDYLEEENERIIEGFVWEDLKGAEGADDGEEKKEKRKAEALAEEERREQRRKRKLTAAAVRREWNSKLAILFYNNLRINIQFFSSKYVKAEDLMLWYSAGFISANSVAHKLHQQLGIPVDDHLLPENKERRLKYLDDLLKANEPVAAAPQASKGSKEGGGDKEPKAPKAPTSTGSQEKDGEKKKKAKETPETAVEEKKRKKDPESEGEGPQKKTKKKKETTSPAVSDSATQPKEDEEKKNEQKKKKRDDSESEDSDSDNSSSSGSEGGENNKDRNKKQEDKKKKKKKKQKKTPKDKGKEKEKTPTPSSSSASSGSESDEEEQDKREEKKKKKGQKKSTGKTKKKKPSKEKEKEKEKTSTSTSSSESSSSESDEEEQVKREKKKGKKGTGKTEKKKPPKEKEKEKGKEKEKKIVKNASEVENFEDRDSPSANESHNSL